MAGSLLSPRRPFVPVWRAVAEGNPRLPDLLAAPGLDHWTFGGLAALSFFTAAFGVVAGLGGGVLLLAVMATIFPPAALIPLHGAIQLGANAGRIVLMRRRILVRLMPAFAVGAVIGAVAGGSLVVTLPTALLQIVLGAFVLYVCWAPRPPAGAYAAPKFFLLGAAGTVLTMFVGATGTLLAPFIAAACPDRRNFVATHAALMSFVHGLKVVVFGALGFAFGPYLPLLAAMIAAGFLGNLAGRALLDRMSERLFRRVFQIVLTALAIRLLHAGLAAEGYL